MPMPMRARYFSAAVIAVAVLTGALVLPHTNWTHVPRAPFVVLLGLQVLLMLTIRLPMNRENPAGPALVSVLLAAIVLLPPGAAALTAAVSSAFMVLRRADPWRVAFSGAVTFLAAEVGGLAYRAVHGHSTLTAADFPRALLPIGLAVLVLSAVPAVLVGCYLVYVGQLTPRSALRDYTLRAGPRNVGYALVGLLTAVLWSVSYDALAAVVLLGPVVVTRWATVQYEEQREAHDAIIRTLVQAVEIKDLYTRGHSERVAKISGMIAAELRLAEERVEVLTYAATLHDVGKLGVPTRLLRKTDRLDDHEFEEIRLHPSRGVEVVRDIAFLDEAYSAILHHHERMDGLGYPSGLRGMRIPPFARIIAVADAFDSMTSTRSYRGARGSDEALTELRANTGSQFDPEIVDAIAAALARAELAGHPWRGDGTAHEDGGEGRPQLAELPPGAVVAEFDHDDPAYQLLAVAEAEGREKPSGDGGHDDEDHGEENRGEDGAPGREEAPASTTVSGAAEASGRAEGLSGCGEAPASTTVSGAAEASGRAQGLSGRGEAPVSAAASGAAEVSVSAAGLSGCGEAPVSAAASGAAELSGCEQAPVSPAASGSAGSSGCASESEAETGAPGSLAASASGAGPGWLDQPDQQAVVPAQSRFTRSASAPDQAAAGRDGLRLASFGGGFTVPAQGKRNPDADAAGDPAPAPASADPEAEGR